MPEIICDTSPIQYLHQIGHLSLLPDLAEKVILPPDVVKELETGRNHGINLLDIELLNWITVRSPESLAALPLVKDLGPGETQVLALALEIGNAVVILDDFLARQVAQSLKIKLIGTLGILLNAKRTGLIPEVGLLLDKLQTLRFRLDPETHSGVLKIAEEST